MSDAYSLRNGNEILLGTEKIAMTLELTLDGRYFLKSLVNKDTGKEYVQPGPVRQADSH